MIPAGAEIIGAWRLPRSTWHLLRKGADAGVLRDPPAWQGWRQLRNLTSQAFDAAKAESVAAQAPAFAGDAAALPSAMEATLGN